MATIHQMDRSKGLDLILHTPGGDVAATESIVDYLRSMFTDIRAVVPQIAMSAGTMIACACNEILMGKHSSLGPIDPQMYGYPAHGIVEEFNRAKREVSENEGVTAIWQMIIAKYPPTLVGECEKAIEWGNEIVREWLLSGMFKDDPERTQKADAILQHLADHDLTKSHSRHISMKRAQELGLRIVALEDDQDLQDTVLSIHHACVETLASTQAIKFIENHLGVTYMQSIETSLSES